MARTPTAAQLRFAGQRTRSLARSQRPFIAQFWDAAQLPPPTPPVNTTLPAITGQPTVGFALTLNIGAWDDGNSPTSYTQQWLRNGANILLNGTGTFYVLVAADNGTNISCRVTATNAAGSTIAVSNVLAIA